MTEAEIKSIALFAYFAFLDEARAVEAASRSLVLAEDKLKKDKSVTSSVAIVWATEKVWNELNGQLLRGHPTVNSDKNWILPKGFDFGPWKEFQKNATEDELLILIWSKILGFNDDEIAQGLGITEGTVRYRMARSLRKLGAMNQPTRR